MLAHLVEEGITEDEAKERAQRWIDLGFMRLQPSELGR